MQSASSDLVSLAEIRTAAGRIAPYVFNTPLVPMVPSGLSLKTESLQPVGAFKIRGAFNAILSLTPEERKRGVIAHSSGNHAQAVAYAAQRLGVTAIIVMPDNAPAVKLEATRRWGAEIHLVDFLGDARMQVCATLAQQHGYVVVPPFDSPTIIAGTGTIGLEILAQRPDVESIYIPVSGGGLISGIAAAVKQSNPAIRVIGVEPEFANDAQQSFRAGHIISIPPEQTIRTSADGLRVSQLGKLPWAHVQAWVDDIITVTEAQIEEAMRRIGAEARLVAEPSGATAAAGALMNAAGLEGNVAILSGGNVDPARYAAILAQ
jgi:threonine dehydratase